MKTLKPIHVSIPERFPLQENLKLPFYFAADSKRTTIFRGDNYWHDL